MERLSGFDALQLYMETPRQCHNVTTVLQVDASTLSSDPTDYIARQVSLRLHLLPEFTRKLVSPWYNIDRPLWAPDADFDIREHVLPLRLSAGGGEDEFMAAVTRLHGTQVPRHRPLWRMYVVTGAQCADQISVVLVMNHAMMDAAAAQAMMDAVSARDIDPVPRVLEVAVSDAVGGSAAAVVLDGLRRKGRRLRALPALIRKSVRARRQKVVKPVAAQHRLHKAPATSLNKTVSGKLSLASLRIGVDEVKALAEAGKATVSDVLMCSAGGALRHVLDERGEDVPSLIAAVMIALREDKSTQYITEGNISTGTLYVDLHDTTREPAARLAQLRTHTAELKNRQRSSGDNLMREWSEYIVGRLFHSSIRLSERFNLADRVPPAANVVISSVAFFAAADSWYLGLPVKARFAFGPLTHSTGIIVTAVAWDEYLNICVVTDERHEVSATEVAGRIRSGFDELRKSNEQEMVG